MRYWQLSMLVCWLSLLFWAAQLPAQNSFTNISNLNQPAGGSVAVQGTQSDGERFITGGTATSLATVSIATTRVNPSSHLGAFVLALFSDASGSPGTILSVLSGNNYPTNAGTYVYTNQTALVLAPQTKYWLVAASSNTTIPAFYAWTETPYAKLDSGSSWTLGYSSRGVGPANWISNANFNVEFNVTVWTNLPTLPLIASLPTASALIQGQTLMSSTLSGGMVTNTLGAVVPGLFTFTSPLTVPAVGTTSESVTFTPTAPVDYYSVTCHVPVAVSVSLTSEPFIAAAPVASTISYGQTLAGSVLTGGAATNAAGAPVPGSFSFTTPATVPALGTNFELVTFFPSNHSVYVTSTFNVPVSVIPFTFKTNTTGVGGITITSYNTAGGTVANIPDIINGLPVTGIGTNAFFHSSVTSVTITTNVSVIGSSAFAGCHNLVSITIPEGVTNIGANAFNVCSSLATIAIPSKLTTLPSAVFAECTALVNVAIPDNITSVGESAFVDCYSLVGVTIGSGVTNIGIQAFGADYALASITVDPKNPAFRSQQGVLFDNTMTTLLQIPCAWSGSYTVPNGITSIGYESFSDCSGLTAVTLPATVTNIAAFAFNSCINLTSIVIPGGVSTLPEYTFAGDTSLTNVTIGGGISSLGAFVFAACPGLSSIYFTGNAPAVDTSDFNSDTAPIAYYLPGSTGWAGFSAITGIPALPWNPQVQTSDGSFGVQSNQFGFYILGGTNLVVVVMACTNLASPVWTPVATNTLNTIVGSNGLSYFSDSQWTNYACRFYGFSFP